MRRSDAVRAAPKASPQLNEATEARALLRTGKALEADSNMVTYKVVVPGSGAWKTWKTVTERCEGMSREAQLERRAKEKADRFCK